MGLVKQKNTGNVIIPAGQSGCCPDEVAAICKHVFIINELASITSITIDGNEHSIVATDETDPGDIVKAIEDAFYAEGYIISNDNNMIPNVKVFIDNDGRTNIKVFTNADTVVLTTVPVVDETYVSCIKTVLCRYNAKIPVGAGLLLEISDSDVEAEDPANSPQVISGDFATGSEDLLATEVETEFVELYAGTENATVGRVRVVENVVGAFFDTDVWLYGRHPNLTTDSEEIVFVLCECVVDHTKAN